MTDGLHVLAASDDVGVVLEPGGPIPVGHKVALRDLPQGSAVRKYGHPIGWTTADVAAGEHVHTHNLAFREPDADAPAPTPVAPELPQPGRATFLGYRRSDGRVGTRNVIAVMATVNCSATVCQQIVAAAERAGLLTEFPWVDAITPVTHTSGCGLAADGPNLVRLQRTLAGYAGHPNTGGLLVVSLGCEMNELNAFFAATSLRSDLPVERLAIQAEGGTRATIAAGVEAVRRLAAAMGPVEREEVPASELVLGLNCGGSDGWSGITANPALGVASDLLVAQGGRSVLAETPEIHGAEQLLLDRATSPEVAAELTRITERWAADAAASGDSLDNNPSPGNKAGGLTTILEKSLGAVAKAGHAPLSAVYEYADRIDTPGLGFMDTPGYDPVSVTGLIAGGATVVVFTTGRGSAIGSALAPVVKVSTNTALFERMGDDMDLDAGRILSRGLTVGEVGAELHELVLDVASGRRTASEELGYGAHEFVPWLQGLVL